MEVNKVTHKDFMRIAKENDFFLWHFLQKNQGEGELLIRSVYEGENLSSTNQINLLLKEIQVPYFESYTEDSIDFLHELGIPYDRLWNPNFNFTDNNIHAQYHPVIIGFKKFQKVETTFDVCYCIDGVVKIIGKISPELILNYQC
jgi:hypothetical protein